MNVALRPELAGIALCAGVGMLDEGARLALRFLGHGYRTVCYVEREAAAAAQLVALMEAGCIDPAPVWSDLLTFDGAAWRGRVDCITAGFPCQPHSVAGQQKGLEDERWIWPAIAGIVGDVGPDLVWLENVPGLAATGGLDACIGDLASLGYDAEWTCLSASAVGASHLRERLFIVAHAGRERRQLPAERQQPAEQVAGTRHARMADANGSHVSRGGAAVMRPDGKSRLDMLDWAAEDFSRRDQTAPSGPTSSPDSPTSPRRLNPAFACWLMGWPCWWTNPGINNSAQSAMESWRRAQLAHMSSYFGEPQMDEAA